MDWLLYLAFRGVVFIPHFKKGDLAMNNVTVLETLKSMSDMYQATRNSALKGEIEYELEYAWGDMLPSGSGINKGSCVDLDAFRNGDIVIQSSYQVMSDSGFCLGWFDFQWTESEGAELVADNGGLRSSVEQWNIEAAEYARMEYGENSIQLIDAIVRRDAPIAHDDIKDEFLQGYADYLDEVFDDVMYQGYKQQV